MRWLVRVAGAAPELWLACALTLIAVPAARAQNRPLFTGVGDLPGGAFDSAAKDVSDDGSVVVGGSESSSGPQAFRWTLAGGMVGLGDLSGGSFNSQANGLSADGSVIVGTGVDSSGNSHAFRWTSGSGLVALNTFFCFSCPPDTFGNGVSPDGLVAFGSGSAQVFAEGVHLDAARWAGGGTSISDLGHLSGGGQASQVNGANSNGSLLVGDSDSTPGVQGFRWTSGGGLVALPGIAGALVNSSAADVSNDGSVIVGFANTSATTQFQEEAVRWVGPGYGTAQLLGGLAGATTPGSQALAVSPDGSLIVGWAHDETGHDAAFLWDAANGMRKLSTVLTQEYGLDLTGWTLTEARGISAINAAGEFYVVGAGVDPAGNPEGWYARLSKPACNDGIDNDGDGKIDYPADPECNSKGDRSETPDCSDGIDNDGDGLVDYPADPKCTSPTDRTELFDCGDGIDNDGDGFVDYPADPGCRSATSPIENPACNDGIDNDGNGAIDFPADRGCVAAYDQSEGPDCSDGIDNDGDGLVDYPADPDCTSAKDPSEDPQCSDGVDNDLDGRVDYPADPGCPSATFGSENPVRLALGDLLVLDRRSRSLFRLDTASGTQTPISTGAQLTSPQGVAVSPSGAIVVADPAGLFQIAASTGAQRRFSSPLTSGVSLQLVFDGSGNPVTLQSNAITSTPFVYGGIAATSPLLTLPVAGSITVFLGDSLAREASGSLLVGGFGLLGDGIYRIGASGSPVTHLTSGFSGDVWNDLAVEASGSVLAAGTRFGVGPGVYRVDAGSGTVTVLSNGAGWVSPSAVAVGLANRIFASDAGTCTTSSCTAAMVVELDPSTGAQLHVWNGGQITGETDLAVVTALPACSDGIDNDGDGKIDYPADIQCNSYEDPSETPDCSDGIDNDGDGLVDYPADPGCGSLLSVSESPACNDGIDNDGDGKIDYPADPQCATPYQNRESPAGCGLGAEALLLWPLLRALVRRRSG